MNYKDGRPLKKLYIETDRVLIRFSVGVGGFMVAYTAHMALSGAIKLGKDLVQENLHL